MTASIPGVTTPHQAYDWWKGVERSARNSYIQKTSTQRAELLLLGGNYHAAYKRVERLEFTRYNYLSKAAWAMYQEALNELLGDDRDGVLPLGEPDPAELTTDAGGQVRPADPPEPPTEGNA